MSNFKNVKTTKLKGPTLSKWCCWFVLLGCFFVVFIVWFVLCVFFWGGGGAGGGYCLFCMFVFVFIFVCCCIFVSSNMISSLLKKVSVELKSIVK